MHKVRRLHLVGNGGREYSLAWYARQSDPDLIITAAPGSDSWHQIGVESYTGISSIDVENQIKLAQVAELTVIGPEGPLILGLADTMREAGAVVYGPSQAAARLEASKAWTGKLLQRYCIPTPGFIDFDGFSAAEAFVADTRPDQYVIKADGIAAGKGVVLPATKEEARLTLIDFMIKKTLGTAGERIVFQQRIAGTEFSAMLISDGTNVIVCPLVQDHKRIFDGDKGPNTGGMGVVGPSGSARLRREVLEIGHQIVLAMQTEGCPFIGTIFLGCMLTPEGIQVLEINCRWGDPETEALMLLSEGNLTQTMYAAAIGQLAKLPEQYQLQWKPGRFATVVVLAAKGYPYDSHKGAIISIKSLVPDSQIFHMGTSYDERTRQYTVSGGRVLAVAGVGTSPELALGNAYKQVSQIYFDGMQYRRDIGNHWLLRSRKR